MSEVKQFHVRIDFMEEQKLKRWLNACGKRTFVLCFKMFQSTYKNVHYLKIAELIPLYDKLAQDNNPQNTLPRKTTYVIDIFEQNMEIKALEICLKSKRLDKETLNLAAIYLNEGKVKNLSAGTEAVTTIIDNNEAKESVKEEREGEFVERRILSRKRNQEIVKQVKERDNYTCRCKMCNFNYNNKIIQAHHLKPLSEADGEIVVKAEDLITLCPNCHAIAHFLLKEDLKYQDKDTLLAKLWSLKLTT